MIAEQAIFTSARTSRASGYHLVARSAGIDGEIASELARWGPSHASLVEGGLHTASISFFPVASEHVVVARTVYGGPEYSDRGSLQVVTRMLLVRRDQLEPYQHHPTRLIQSALCLGYLHGLPTAGDLLPSVNFPDRPIPRPEPDPPSGQTCQEVMIRRFREGRPLAIVGASDPLELLRVVTARTAPSCRCDLSFTVGLKPSALRPFQFHFFARARQPLRRQLAALGIACLDMADRQVAQGKGPGTSVDMETDIAITSRPVKAHRF